jgi:hypothetical protein
MRLEEKRRTKEQKIFRHGFTRINTDSIEALRLEEVRLEEKRRTKNGKIENFSPFNFPAKRHSSLVTIPSSLFADFDFDEEEFLVAHRQRVKFGR